MATVQFEAGRLDILDPHHTKFVQLFLKLLWKLENEFELRGLMGRIRESKSCWVADVTWQGKKLPVLNHTPLVATNLQEDTYILCDPWGWNPTSYRSLEGIFRVYCEWVLKLAKEGRTRYEKLIGELELDRDK